MRWGLWVAYHGRRSHCGHPKLGRDLPAAHPDLDPAWPGVCGSDLFLGLQSGTPVVAQARARDRSLLLVHHPAVVALSAHRAPHRGRGAAVRHHHDRGSDRVLRGWARPAGGSAVVAAGGDLPRRRRCDHVLDPSDLSWSDDVEVSRGSSFLDGSRLDLGGPLSSGQHRAWQRCQPTSSCCWREYRPMCW